jgi:hypothetical protein
MQFTFTHPMHSHPYNPELVTGSGIATVAAAAEAAGFHGFGFTDHPAPTQRWLEAGGHDAVDPFVAMGFAAARTTTLRLIPNIVVLPYRSPFVVAKSGATLDLLSDGRFTLAAGRQPGARSGYHRAVRHLDDQRYAVTRAMSATWPSAPIACASATPLRRSSGPMLYWAHDTTRQTSQPHSGEPADAGSSAVTWARVASKLRYPFMGRVSGGGSS